jgi:UDP-N-acetylmuramate dehydrogenase
MISLLPYNTFKIDASASALYHIECIEDLLAIPLSERESAYILGGGSNTLFTCEDCGIILHVANKGIDVLYKGDGENIVLTVAAGEVWNDVVRFAVESNMWGVENLVDIYGTVGGAAVQNIGAYGSEFKDVVLSIDVVNLLSGEKFTLPAAECEYGYRTSVFKRQPHWLVWSVKLRLRVKAMVIDGAAMAQESKRLDVSGERYTSKEIAAQVSALRSSKLPPLELYASAGSFFKNPIITKTQFNAIREQYPDLNGYPASDRNTVADVVVGVKISAGWLIEKCGFKGICEGNVGVYEKQALVLINFGGASGKQVMELAQKIIISVKEKFDITLLPEVVVV